jgi:hypothetical protein
MVYKFISGFTTLYHTKIRFFVFEYHVITCHIPHWIEVVSGVIDRKTSFFPAKLINNCWKSHEIS